MFVCFGGVYVCGGLGVFYVFGGVFDVSGAFFMFVYFGGVFLSLWCFMGFLMFVVVLVVFFFVFFLIFPSFFFPREQGLWCSSPSSSIPSHLLQAGKIQFYPTWSISIGCRDGFRVSVGFLVSVEIPVATEHSLTSPSPIKIVPPHPGGSFILLGIPKNPKYSLKSSLAGPSPTSSPSSSHSTPFSREKMERPGRGCPHPKSLLFSPPGSVSGSFSTSRVCFRICFQFQDLFPPPGGSFGTCPHPWDLRDPFPSSKPRKAGFNPNPHPEAEQGRIPKLAVPQFPHKKWESWAGVIPHTEEFEGKFVLMDLINGFN